MLEQLKVLDIGGKDGNRCASHYPDADITILDLIHGYDIMKLGLPKEDWDILFANHIIEHVSDPDFLLDECKRVMGFETILEIGTPNLAAWYNRLLFLVGYVPNHVELSKRWNVGKPFNWGNVPLGGHIYVYTVPALVSLLKHHGFKDIKVFGESSTFPCNIGIKMVDNVLTKISPTFASAFRVRCTI